MCILCVVHNWSRKVATMLPWLVIPLIFLWALSQLLPPGLRFEITYPRIACVAVLLLTLFWYEILFPQLSAWRVRRAARLRERRRVRSLELQKLRKSATRRCRNCHTPYRDQNPAPTGGRFMCSYCGHVSKRPVLDIQDWSPESAGDWAPHPDPRYLIGTDAGGDERCSTVRPYSGVLCLVSPLLSWFFFRTRWLGRKVFRAGSEDGYSDTENQGLSSRKGEDGGVFHESRGEKARRKAEEKKQARLEKEMLEEEERKQREEVARLVEERRRMRDEKSEAEKKHLKSMALGGGERGGGKETERRRQERKKEKDVVSNKSNSDCEEPEKSASRESERKQEFDKKTEHERRDSQKTLAENHKLHASEPVHGSRSVTNKTRYFDRVKGTFFGRNARSSVGSATKASKPADHKMGNGNTRDSHATGHLIGKSTQNGFKKPLGTDTQPRTTVPKKSWHQLFTRSSAVSPYPDTNTCSYPTQNNQLEVETQSLQATAQTTLHNVSTDNHISSGQALPSIIQPSSDGLFNSNLIAGSAAKSMYPSLVTKPGHESLPEEAELFEDPCYVPDAISLQGSVSEPLNDFRLDLGAGFITNGKIEGSRGFKNVSASVDMKRPSPIESPMSKLRGSEERHTASGQVICAPKSKKLDALNSDDSSSKAHEQGTWHMWGTPLIQDGLGLIGGSSGWSFPIGLKKSIQEDVLPLYHKEHAKENHALSNPQNALMFSPHGHGLHNNDPFINNSLFQQSPVEGSSRFLPHDLIDNITQNEVTYGIPDSSASGHPLGLSAANCWPMGEWRMHGPKGVGGQFRATNPGGPSVW